MLMTMKQGCGLARAGQQILLRHSKGCTTGKVEDHREERRSSVLLRTLAGEWRLGRHQQGLTSSTTAVGQPQM